MIEADRLTKRYGPALAVDGLSFDVVPGRVTGFLGPNGAGKSTTMRLVLGLDSPSSGSVTVCGRPYSKIRRPLFEVGASLEASSVHPGRSARAHLLALARSNAIPRRRVEETLGMVGLESVAGRRAGTFSLGMAQRLGLAAALLGDPAVLLLDEPVNGLDPEGVVWLRGLLRALAHEGRTVFVSSHMMAEMALTADHLVVIGRGRLIADTTVEDFVRRAAGGQVRARSPEHERLGRLLQAEGATVEGTGDGALAVSGLSAAAVGKVAALNAVELHELVGLEPTLEEAFMELTGDATEYRSASGFQGTVG